MKEPIYVTKSFTPPLAEYQQQLEKIWATGYFTNQGPCVQELETLLQNYLSTPHVHFLHNGTIALQLALAALDIHDGEIITTPFSYVATVSSILWQRCTPVFVDIEGQNFTIDVQAIEKHISPKTKAIMAVHVFGYACHVQAIEHLAQKYNLKVIYDGAHAFGCTYKGKALLQYGDMSTTSFHATKLFHTGEGGACIMHDAKLSEKMDLIKRFGHHGDTHFCLGINGKNSELHAAMGLTNFPYLSQHIALRKEVSLLYDSLLQDNIGRPAVQKDLVYNYSYYPVIFRSEQELITVFEALAQEAIFARRYFYPSLNTLPYVEFSPCPVAEDIATRIACLPLYPDLPRETVQKICTIILSRVE